MRVVSACCYGHGRRDLPHRVDDLRGSGRSGRVNRFGFEVSQQQAHLGGLEANAKHSIKVPKLWEEHAWLSPRCS